MLVPKVSSLERVECLINKNNEEIEHNFTSILICINNIKDILPRVRESRTVWDSGIHNGFQHFVIRTWILDFDHQWDSGFLQLTTDGIQNTTCILDAKTQDFGFHNQKFSGFRNPDSLSWGEQLLSFNAKNSENPCNYRLVQDMLDE